MRQPGPTLYGRINPPIQRTGLAPAPTLAVYCDKDEVLADFELGKRRVLGDNAPDLNVRTALLDAVGRAAKQRLYDAIRADPDVYFTLPPMPDLGRLLTAVRRFRPTVLTAAPSLFMENRDTFAAVADAMWRWCSAHVDPVDMTDFVCTTSAEKPRYIGYRPADLQLLIDDRRENCAEWVAHGGIAIQRRNAEETVRMLAEMEATYHWRPALHAARSPGQRIATLR